MKTPAWLSELHRQWFAARGKRVTSAARPFHRKWDDLLDAARVGTASERECAEREASALEKNGRLLLKRHRYRRYLIESVVVPLQAESWLGALLGNVSAAELREQSLNVLNEWRKIGHKRCPESWEAMCSGLLNAFAGAKSVRPFPWHKPEMAGRLLSITHGLTSREWNELTLVRAASVELGLDSKALERHRPTIESALTLLFGRPTPLEALGLVCTESRTTLHGPLTLHFQDGTVQDFDALRSEYTVSHADLQRATRATTAAAKLLSIENTKTTFRQAALANQARDTLLLATSFPNTATKRLLQLLPIELPHFHFGDTDASGYAILKYLRETSPRPVGSFLMEWQDDEASPLLSERDQMLLPTLMKSLLMSDCGEDLQRMITANRKGRFEQEVRGAPILMAWPFWSINKNMT